jgi:hypothetical protein
MPMRGGRQGLTMLDTRTNCASTKATKRCKRLGGWCGTAASAVGCMSVSKLEGGGKSCVKSAAGGDGGGFGKTIAGFPDVTIFQRDSMPQNCAIFTAFREAPPPLRQRVAKERGTLQRCQLIPVTWSIESWAAAACVCRASPWAASPSPGTGAQGRTLGRQWRVSLLLVFALTPAPRR